MSNQEHSASGGRRTFKRTIGDKLTIDVKTAAKITLTVDGRNMLVSVDAIPVDIKQRELNNQGT